MTSYFYVKACFLIGDYFFFVANIALPLQERIRKHHHTQSAAEEQRRQYQYHTHTHRSFQQSNSVLVDIFIITEYQLTAWITISVYGPLRLCEHASFVWAPIFHSHCSPPSAAPQTAVEYLFLFFWNNYLHMREKIKEIFYRLKMVCTLKIAPFKKWLQ